MRVASLSSYSYQLWWSHFSQTQHVLALILKVCFLTMQVDPCMQTQFICTLQTYKQRPLHTSLRRADSNCMESHLTAVCCFRCFCSKNEHRCCFTLIRLVWEKRAPLSRNTARSQAASCLRLYTHSALCFKICLSDENARLKATDGCKMHKHSPSHTLYAAHLWSKQPKCW